MTQTQCQKCGGKSVTFLCGKHTGQLRDTLAEFGWWLHRLTETETGQARLGTNGGRKTTRRDDLDGDADLWATLAPLPERMHTDQANDDRRKQALENALAAGGVNANAALLLASIADQLGYWCRVLCEARGLTYTPPAIRNRPSAYGQNHALWLWANVDAIACSEDAGDIYRDVRAFRRQAEVAVNRPLRWLPLGGCPAEIRVEGPNVDGKAHPTAPCGEKLRAHDEQADVRCPECRTLHSVAWLQLSRRSEAETQPRTFPELVKFNASQHEDWRVPRATLFRWRQVGMLEPCEHTDDGDPLYSWVDVELLRVARPQKAATGAAARVRA